MKNRKLKVTLIIITFVFIIFFGFKSRALVAKKNILNNNEINQIYVNNDNPITVKTIVKSGLENADLYYSVPKDAFILTSKPLIYKVVENTLILDKPNGNRIRILRIGEFLKLNSIDGEYGIFNTMHDNIVGYVDLGDLKISNEDPISLGISKVDKAIKNADSYYVLAEGENVTIKGHDKGKFTILDNNNLEFLVDDSDIELRASNEPVSRSLISRRTQSLTKLISSAHDLIGSPYIYGDIGKRGFDCSGFIYSLYLNQLEIKLPRSSYEQVNSGSKVDKTDLVPGDLLFFNTTGKRISHVGLYIGDGNMIHASSGKARVRIDSINEGYYNQRYVTARRIVK